MEIQQTRRFLRHILKPHYHFLLRMLHHLVFVWNHIPIRRRWQKYNKLEVGSGSIRRPGWISSDYRPGCDLMLDITRKWPFKDETLQELYCCHVLEHFSHVQLKYILREAHRVLKTGGRFRISVPDLDIFLKAYANNNTEIMKFEPAKISMCSSDILNYIFYMDGEHKNMFDFENMTYHLSNAGFSRIDRRPYDENLDGTGRDDESLFVVCYK